MLHKRKQEHDLDRTTELYDFCDNVMANVSQIAKEAELMRDTERGTLSVKSTSNIKITVKESDSFRIRTSQLKESFKIETKTQEQKFDHHN